MSFNSSRVTIYLTGLFLFGCLGFSTGCVPKAPYRLSLHSTYQLQPVSGLQSRSMSLQIRGTSPQQDAFRLVAQLEIKPKENRMVMVAFSPIGRRLFVLQLHNNRLAFEPSPGYRPPLPPRVLVEHLQHCIWPAGVIQQGWNRTKTRWLLSSSKPEQYTLVEQGQIILEQTRKSLKSFQIAHKKLGYTLHLTLR